MSLSLEDRFKQLLPSWFYYRRKIRSELRRGEPEFGLLGELLPGHGGAAVDVGCNRGLYSYVLAGLCDRVFAFEPNPDLAAFARGKLPRNVELLEVALGAAPGTAVLHIPVDLRGREDHLKASLASAEGRAGNRRVSVELRTLDSFGIADVRFIKIDVEGTELAVLAGAASTIARDRPLLLVELLVGNHGDALEAVRTICETYGYDAFVATGEGLALAIPFLEGGGEPPSRNVIFKPAA